MPHSSTPTNPLPEQNKPEVKSAPPSADTTKKAEADKAKTQDTVSNTKV